MKFLDKMVFTNKTHILLRSASVAITILLAVYCISRNNNDLKFNNMLFEFIADFQTLIAGIFAIWAAWYTVNAMNKQEKDRRYRASLLHRSELPLAINNLLEQQTLLLEYIYGEAQNEYYASATNYFFTKKDSHNVSVINKNIECSDNQTAQSLYEIVKFYNKQNSKYEESLRNKSVESNNNEIAIIIIRMTNYLVQLLPYSKNEVKVFKINKNPSKEQLLKTFEQLTGKDNSTKRIYEELRNKLIS